MIHTPELARLTTVLLATLPSMIELSHTSNPYTIALLYQIDEMMKTISKVDDWETN